MTDSYVIVQNGAISVEIESPVADVVVVQGPQGVPGETGPAGPSGIMVQKLDSDGITGEFQLDVPTADQSVQVFRNGLAEIAGVGFTTSSDGGSTVVSFSTVPLVDDEVQVVYRI